MSAPASTVARPERGVAAAFLRACASAWLCLRRPAFLLPSFGVVATFAVMMVVGIFLSASRPGGSRMTDPPSHLVDLAKPGALALLAGGIVSITASCVLAVAAAHLASAFSSGSVRIQLVRQPRRRIWVLGNLAVLALLAVILTVVAVAAVVVSAYVVAPAYGVPTGRWATSAAWGPLAATTSGLAGAMVGFAMLGALVAAVVRSAIAAVAIGLCYGLFESLIAGVAGPVARFLPAQNLAALATGGNDRIGFGWAVCGSAFVVAAAVVVAAEIVARRDVLD